MSQKIDPAVENIRQIAAMVRQKLIHKTTILIHSADTHFFVIAVGNEGFALSTDNVKNADIKELTKIATKIADAINSQQDATSQQIIENVEKTIRCFHNIYDYIINDKDVNQIERLLNEYKKVV